MKNTFTAMCTALLMILPTISQAGYVWAYGVEIDKLRAVSNGGFILTPKNAPVQTCDSFKFYVNQSQMTVDGAKSHLSLMMTAAVQKMSVDIRYDDATSDCYVLHSLVSGF